MTPTTPEQELREKLEDAIKASYYRASGGMHNIAGVETERTMQLITQYGDTRERLGRIDEAKLRYNSAKRLLDRSRKWQLTQDGRRDMIIGENLMPAEDRLKQLGYNFTELREEVNE